MSDSRFENNRAGYTGGGFYILGSWLDPVTTPRAEATIVNCTFDGNTADNDPGVPTIGPTEGGGMHSEDQATVKVFNSRFIKNDADLGGGISQYRSINEIESSVFLGNRALGANGFGGAIKSASEDTPRDGATNRRSVSLTVQAIRCSWAATKGSPRWAKRAAAFSSAATATAPGARPASASRARSPRTAPPR